MIDEDLYQQATDELNSDKRQLHIWARACALASDDHDEARYLYTNLRVEELIAERENHASLRSNDDSPDSGYQYDATLVLEPHEPDDAHDGNQVPESMSALASADLTRTQQEILTLNSEMEKNNVLIDSIERKSFERTFHTSDDTLDTINEQHDDGFSEDFLDETINLTSELDGTAVFELDKSDAAQIDSNEFGENVATQSPASKTVLDDDNEEDELETLLGGVYQASPPAPPTDPLADNDSVATMTLDFSEVSDSHAEFGERLDERLHERSDEHLEQTDGEEHGEWTDDEQPLEEDNRELQSCSPRTRGDGSLNETDRLARELERQANDLPGQRSDIVAETHVAEDDQSFTSAEDEHEIASSHISDAEAERRHEMASGETFDEEAERDIAESLQRKRASESRVRQEDNIRDSQSNLELEDDGGDHEHVPADDTASTLNELPVAAAVAATGAASTSHATTRHVQELPVDLSGQQSGKRYTVFRRGDQVQAVRNGVSWSALFLTLPYLIYRHLFGTALVYGALWLIVMTGLLVSGLAWLDAGAAASSLVKYTTVGFALLALIGLLYLPFRHANQWREDKLEQRGFELVAWVRATSPGKAISAARRAATLD